jgi:two-component system NtrC family sensor kinase
MPKGGKLTIRVKTVKLRGEVTTDGLSGEFVAIRFSDTGHGIASDIMPHVFEPFFTTKEVGKGTGLGLSQVYGFARQSGGTATVTSGRNAGTAIMLYLPSTEELPANLSVSIAETAEQSPSTGKVLIVEDNPDVADVCSAYFEQLGYQIKWVPGGIAALELLKTDRSIDLVFSDILMPGSMNGLELGREIRRLYPALPVILSTGYSNSAQDALSQGFVVLQKPYTIALLRRCLREAASTREAQGGGNEAARRARAATETSGETVVS